MGYPVHASRRAQHSTPLLCTVLSDTSPPPRGGCGSRRETWLKSQREKKTGQTPGYPPILRVEELSHKCATLSRVARGSCRGVL